MCSNRNHSRGCSLHRSASEQKRCCPLTLARFSGAQTTFSFNPDSTMTSARAIIVVLMAMAARTAGEFTCTATGKGFDPLLSSDNCTVDVTALNKMFAGAQFVCASAQGERSLRARRECACLNS